jgi:glycosyltransferase involved in cell wall biosynthesis
MPPVISVIIAAYNSGPWLVETVDSVLAQTWPYREIIVVDDGSTEDLQACLAPRRSAVAYIRQRNAGPGAARNAGLRVAVGDYVAFLDHDDLWLPEKLSIQLAVATRHPESGLIVCDGVQFDGDRILRDHLIGGPLAERLAAAPEGEITGRFYREFLRGHPLACPAQGLIPRPVVDRIGPLSTVRGEASDLDYYLRIANAYPVTLHRDRLVRWRYLPSSVSGPQERRSVEWAVMTVGVLGRQRALCAPEDRPAVVSRFREVAREAAGEAFHYGMQRDRAYGRTRLARLHRVAPRESRAWLYLAALGLPSPLVTALIHARRRLRAWGCRPVP